MAAAALGEKADQMQATAEELLVKLMEATAAPRSSRDHAEIKPSRSRDVPQSCRVAGQLSLLAIIAAVASL